MIKRRIENNLCTECDGRGFLWQKQVIMSKRDGKPLADTIRRGDDCPHCNGTGIAAGGLSRALFWLLYLAFALAVSAFVIQPLIKAWLD